MENEERTILITSKTIRTALLISLFLVLVGFGSGYAVARSTINRNLVDGGFLNTAGVANVERSITNGATAIAGIYEDVGVTSGVITEGLSESQSTTTRIGSSLDRAYDLAESTGDRLSKLTQLLGVIKNRQ